MRKIALILITLYLAAIAISAQEVAGPRLIIRSDDMGSSHAANSACIQTALEGITTSIEVMVVTSWFPEAVRILNSHPEIDVGLHLVLTSEWDNVKWRPLTHCPSLIDTNGYFYPQIVPNKHYPTQALTENNWNLEEIEKEFRAQIELIKKNIPHVSHMSAHMGAMRFDKDVSAMVRKLAEEYGLHAVSINPLEDYGLRSAGYDGAHKTINEKTASFISMLNKLENGKSYVFVDHPSYDTDDMRATHHIGYEEVAMDRQGVTDLLTDERVIEVIKARNIKLISYADLFAD